MKARKWHIEFDIIDQPPEKDIGYVASYYRKEAIDKIKVIFSDYYVVNLKCKEISR